MKWRVVKLLCIAGAGVVGVLITGEPLAAVLTAPFGWILGRAMELNAEVRRVEKRSMVLQTDRLQQFDEDRSDKWPYSVIYLDPTAAADPSYVVLPDNIWYDYNDE